MLGCNPKSTILHVKTQTAMKSVQLICLFMAFLPPLKMSAQCESQIVEDRVIEGTHTLRTMNQTLVVRGNYTYSMELISDKKGITAKVYSKAGVEFNQDDEIIFMDDNTVRRAYRFIGALEASQEGATPVYTNILQLDLAAIQWFASVGINTIYIKNNISKEMRKFTINDSRKAEFSQLVACFNQRLDKSKVKDVELTGNEIVVTPSPKSTGTSAAPAADGSKAQPRPAANPQ
jgi:hypothetical protein